MFIYFFYLNETVIYIFIDWEITGRNVSVPLKLNLYNN